MSSLPPDEAFSRVFKGDNNFLTPSILRCGVKGNYFYELSTGRGMSNQPIYGVTVITKQLERTNLGKMFQTTHEAEEYINQLKNMKE